MARLSEALAFVVKKKKRDEWVLVGDAECIRSTALALLVRVPYSVTAKLPLRPSMEVWIPKSQLHPTENEITKLGDKGFLVIKDWIAKEKGLL